MRVVISDTPHSVIREQDDDAGDERTQRPKPQATRRGSKESSHLVVHRGSERTRRQKDCLTRLLLYARHMRSRAAVIAVLIAASCGSAAPLVPAGAPQPLQSTNVARDTGAFTPAPTPIPTAVPNRLIGVVNSGFTATTKPSLSDPYFAQYAVVLRNDNATEAAQSVIVSVQFVDEGGVVLAEESRTLVYLAPHEETGIAGTSAKEGAGKATKINVRSSVRTWSPSSGSAGFTGGSGQYLAQAYGVARVTGVVASAYSKDLRMVDIVALGIDGNGNLVGGGSGTVDFVPAMGKAAVSVYYHGAKPTQVLLYGQIGQFTY